MHQIKLLIAWILGVAMLMVLFFLWRESQASPFQPDLSVLVSDNGIVYQDEYIIARGKDVENGQEIRIPLVTPYTSEEVLSAEVSIDFTLPNARELLDIEPISIQGTEGIQWYWESSQTLHGSLVNVSPESHTFLLIRAPAEFFEIPWQTGVINALEDFSPQNWLFYALLIVSITLIFAFWRTRPVRWSAVGEYGTAPNNLTLMEFAVLRHGSIESMDLVALLYNLAERGYIDIVEKEDTVVFLRTKKEDNLQNYERNLLLLLFNNTGIPVRLKDILDNLNQELFSAVVSQIYIDIYDGFNAKHYFRDNPRFIHLRYKTAGILFQLVGLLTAALGYFFLEKLSGLALIGLGIYLSGYILFSVGYHVVPLSKEGREVVKICARFVNYLSNPKAIGPEGSQGYLFYQLVPYALVARVGKQWQQRFVGIRWYVPEWYDYLEDQIIDPDKFITQIERTALEVSKALAIVKDPNAD